MSLSNVLATKGEQQRYCCIELDKTEAKKAHEFKPGQALKITLIGTLRNLSFRSPDDREESGFVGSLSLDIQAMELGISRKNEIAELLDEDEC